MLDNEPVDGAAAPDLDADMTKAPAAPRKKKKASAKAGSAKGAGKKPAKRATKRAEATPGDAAPAEAAPGEAASPADSGTGRTTVATLLFQAPEPTERPARRTRKPAAADSEVDVEADNKQSSGAEDQAGDDPGDDSGDDAGDSPGRRRRRRGGRRRRKAGDSPGSDDADSEEDSDASEDDDTDESAESTSRRRRRRRRGDDGEGEDAKPAPRTRSRRASEDEIVAVSGSTRLEAKKQRRREGREAGRRRVPIVSEAEFLARRESVDRVMAVRQRGELTQIGVLEDRVLVEHYVARESQTSLIGNVYLGRVQNVLPSMEAAFVDIGKGRNAVLYAGEVNWSALGLKDGQPRKIESVLTSGQTILVQVTKDPVGHKGARLTSQVSLAGRFLVYVPDGTTSGISRKLPDTERQRLKALLKEIVPDTAGVIVRTAAEGASEDELTRDVERLKARWEDIEKKAKGSAPVLLYGEPDLTLKVVRDLFTEDFSKLVIDGDDAWETVHAYVAHVAPDLEARLEKYEPVNGQDVFSAYRVDEQIHKGLDRKVWLPSGGSLIIDRTEAMTVIDVNTGKFTGSGGNLEETVTRNNLEAADEIVRQLRLRDIGGIIVIDFIDMVLESNRDLVLRRLAECLGRDRTRHQVAEVTSLGLVQMTRKRIGTGLLEAFSETCEHCQGRGLIVQSAPVAPRHLDDGPRTGRRGRGRGRGTAAPAPSRAPSPADVAAMARPDTEPSMSPDEVADDPADVADQPAAEASVPDTPDADYERDAAEPVAEAEPVEPTEVAIAEPVAPAVVVRTRRRAASRPAGPPADLNGAAPAPEPDTVAKSPGESLGESRGESRGVDDDPADHEEHPVEHVPIKRKGARKR